MQLFTWRGRTSKKAFRDRLCLALRKHFIRATVEATGELDIRVSGLSDGRSLNVWLGRAYREFCDAPAEAEQIIERWVRSVVASASDAIDPDRVVPAVKPANWLKDQPPVLNGDGTPGRFEPWTEAYNAELMVVYAEFRDGLRFKNRSDFEALGIPLPELRDRALVNLRRAIAGPTVTGGSGNYLLGAGGTLDASLILLDEVVRDSRLEIRGNPLVAVSDRDSFWIADDSNPFAVFRVASSVARCYRTEPYPISPQLFYKLGTVYEPLDPAPVDESHPIPSLNVIDVHATKHGGGSDLAVIIASPLRADARSVLRLIRKLDVYLEEINSESYRLECGSPTPRSTSIVVRLHPDSDPAIEDLLRESTEWVASRSASLRVEALSPTRG